MEENKVKSIGLISAQNPQGIRLEDKINNKLNYYLQLDLKSMHLDIKKVYGSFAGYPEEAFIVTNISKKDIIKLGIKYGQEAVIWGYKNNKEFRFKYIEKDKIKQIIDMPYKGNYIKNTKAIIKAISDGKFSIPYFFISK